MSDDDRTVQLWTVAVAGGEPRQVTHGGEGITSAFTWSPDGWNIAHTVGGSVCITRVSTGETRRLTPPRVESAPEPLACVFSPDGRQIAFTRKVTAPGGTFAQIFTVSVESP